MLARIGKERPCRRLCATPRRRKDRRSTLDPSPVGPGAEPLCRSNAAADGTLQSGLRATNSQKGLRQRVRAPGVRFAPIIWSGPRVGRLVNVRQRNILRPVMGGLTVPSSPHHSELPRSKTALPRLSSLPERGIYVNQICRSPTEVRTGEVDCAILRQVD
jgi:hypothetical protein